MSQIRDEIILTYFQNPECVKMQKKNITETENSRKIKISRFFIFRYFEYSSKLSHPFDNPAKLFHPTYTLGIIILHE